MKKCTKCGIDIPYGSLCQTCRKYLKNGGVWHELPKYGTVGYDNENKPICHICGMACDKLIEHVKRKHSLNSAEYRTEFGIMKTARLVSPKYADKMRAYTEDNKTHDNNFQSTWSGEARGIGGRKGQHWSEQEIELRRQSQIEKGSLSKSRITPERMTELGKIWSDNLPNKKIKHEEK